MIHNNNKMWKAIIFKVYNNIYYVSGCLINFYPHLHVFVVSTSIPAVLFLVTLSHNICYNIVMCVTVHKQIRDPHTWMRSWLNTTVHYLCVLHDSQFLGKHDKEQKKVLYYEIYTCFKWSKITLIARACSLL